MDEDMVYRSASKGLSATGTKPCKTVQYKSVDSRGECVDCALCSRGSRFISNQLIVEGSE